MALPRKKIILVAVVATGVIFTVVYFRQSQIVTYVADPLKVAETNDTLIVDTDNDGLKDWEEELWKTDRLKQDTDKDGTSDGAEIKLGRNPLIAGPNDKLDTETLDTKINTEIEDDLTQTDKFSRELFMKIVGAKQSPTPPTEAEFQKFLSATVNNEINAQKSKVYTESDLRIDTAETPEKIKRYGNNLAEILTKKPAQELEYEIAILERAEQNNDPSELKKLDPLIAEYKRIENDLLKIVVPQSATTVHLSLTNASVALAWSITGLKYIFSDPIKALPGLSAYADNSQNFLSSIRQFKNYFGSKKVVFNEDDSGYQFFDTI